MTDPLIKKAGDLSVANYKPDLTVVVSDPSLASLPDNDPLKQSKVIQLSDILSLAKNWDVTPEAIIGLADPVVTDTVNCTVDNQTGIISFDLTTAPVPSGQNAAYHIGVAKTNTTLSALVPGTATFLGLETTEMRATTTVGIVGLVIANPGLTAQQMAESLSASFLESPNGEVNHASDYFYASAGRSGAQTASIAGASIKNDIIATQPSPTALQEVPPNTALVGVGNRMSVLLNKESDSLSIGFAISTADETFFDVIDSLVVTNNPTLNPEAEVFVFFLGLNFGGGWPTLSVKPLTTSGKSSYDVTGTTYVTAVGKTQQDWDAAFPHPITPMQTTTYTNAVLPDNITPGTLLFATVAPSYTYNYIPSPYGKQVKDKSLVIVTDTGVGTEDFVVINNKESLDELQAAITSNTNSITQLSSAVSSAAKLADLSEVLIYVINQTSSPVITGSSLYDTFDEAYEYALTIPLFVKKRIILDDRFGTVYEGEIITATSLPKKYMLMTNNITLSTFSAYTDGNRVLGFSVTFRAFCDGLRLIDFDGYIQQLYIPATNGSHHVVNLDEDVAPQRGTRFNPDNFVIGKNSRVVADSNAVLDINGGTIVMLDNAEYYPQFLDINSTPLSNPIVITKSPNSKLTLSGNKQPYTSFTSEPAIQIVTSRNEYPTVNTVNPPEAVRFYYTNPAVPPLFVYDGYAVIRTLDDLIFNSIPNSSNSYRLQTGKYWILGEIDVGNNIFFISTNVTIVGSHGSKLIGNSLIFTNPTASNYNLTPTIVIDHVDFHTRGTLALRILGNLYMSNSKVTGLGTVRVEGSDFINVASFTNCTFGTKDLPQTGLNVTKCNVFIDGVKMWLNRGDRGLSFLGDAVRGLTMNNVLATYIGGQQLAGYLIDLGDINVGSASGDINISNVEIIASNSVEQQPRYNLLGAFGAPVDVDSILRYNIDTQTYYAGCNTTATTINSPIIGELIIVPISFNPNNTDGARGFVITNDALIYVGKVPRTFMLDATAGFLSVSGSSAATFVVTKNGSNYSTVDIPSSATQLNEQARIKCPVKLKYGDSLVFNMVNNTTTNPFTRFNISVSLTES